MDDVVLGRRPSVRGRLALTGRQSYRLIAGRCMVHAGIDDVWCMLGVPGRLFWDDRMGVHNIPIAAPIRPIDAPGDLFHRHGIVLAHQGPCFLRLAYPSR